MLDTTVYEPFQSDEVFGFVANCPEVEVESAEVALCRMLGVGERYVNKFYPSYAVDESRWECCRLSDDEWVVLSTFFPSSYREGRYYAFEKIPQPVLEVWEEAKKSGFFGSFEIRTVENRSVHTIASQQQKDPVLIGYRHAKPYLLARWGMESPGHMSMQDIAHTVRRLCLRRAKMNAKSVVASALVMAVSLGVMVYAYNLAYWYLWDHFGLDRQTKTLGMPLAFCVWFFGNLFGYEVVVRRFRLRGSLARKRAVLQRYLAKIPEAAAAARVLAAA